jgi:hypothetical protein
VGARGARRTDERRAAGALGAQGLTPAALAAEIARIEQEKAGAAQRTCTRCGRVMGRRQLACVYCGQAREVESPFELL